MPLKQEIRNSNIERNSKIKKKMLLKHWHFSRKIHPNVWTGQIEKKTSTKNISSFTICVVAILTTFNIEELRKTLEVMYEEVNTKEENVIRFIYQRQKIILRQKSKR